MQSALHIGRIGPLNINLNYTWLLASILELWWLGLLWLPGSFPDRTSVFYWTGAALVLLLFLVSVILHELIHTAVAGTGRRNVNLYPFGAGTPFGTGRSDPGRALTSAILAPLFSIVLGLILIGIGSAFGNNAGPDFLRALATPLGQLNLALGILNLIPGTPFDMGWALRSFAVFFSGDTESGAAITRTIGTLASIGLVLAGAWVGLSSDSWLLALALVLVGWAAREASAAGQRRRMLSGIYNELQAENFMEPVQPADSIPETATVAEAVRTHRNYAPHKPLPVIDPDGRLLGVVTLAQTNGLLQGAWPTTPATALMTRLDQAALVPPHATLSRVLALAETQSDTADEETFIPVVDNGRMIGSINPGHLHAYEEIERAFGIEDTDVANQPARGGFLGSVMRVVPVLILLAFAAILGSIALRANPAEPINIAPGGNHITFSAFTPSDGSIVDTSQSQVSVQAVGASPITTATITLDGDVIPVDLAGASPLTQTVTANLPSLTQGVHNVKITASTENGQSKSAQWQFRVSLQGTADEQKPAGQAEPNSRALDIIDFTPPLGGSVLAGAENLTVSIILSGPEQPKSVHVYVDGEAVDSTITAVAGADGRYNVSAQVPNLPVGAHEARVQIEQPTGDLYSSQWFFSALKPDADNAYFEQTGFFVAQPFLDYWNSYGGLGAFGYPISYRLQETDKATGETYTTQYFERARMELHSSTGNQVVLGRLGAIIHAPEPAAEPIPGAQFFKETGHNLSGPFLDYWNSHGALALFGYPISEVVTETNPIDGKQYQVQYFERNRFELHPEKAGTPYEVQLGLLGSQIYQQK